MILIYEYEFCKRHRKSVDLLASLKLKKNLFFFPHSVCHLQHPSIHQHRKVKTLLHKQLPLSTMFFNTRITPTTLLHPIQFLKSDILLCHSCIFNYRSLKLGLFENCTRSCTFRDSKSFALDKASHLRSDRNSPFL